MIFWLLRDDRSKLVVAFCTSIVNDEHRHEKDAHALVEVCKAYHKAVQAKTGLTNSGRSLMQEAWSWSASILRAAPGSLEPDEKFHDGLKLPSGGVMG
jgi:hypothetical protein